MRPESETSNFEILVPSKIQLQESETGFQPKKDLLLRNSTLFIAYWKKVCEYARGIRYVAASFTENFRTVLQPSIHLQLAVDNPINF